MFTLSPELAHRARRLNKAWLSQPPSPYEQAPNFEPILGEGALGMLEHLIHEMAHASLLGLPYGPGLSDRIAKALSQLPDTGIDQEAQTWAVEWQVWKHLKLKQPEGPFDIGDIHAAAEIQGCTEDQVNSYLDNEHCVQLGADIAEFLSPGSTS